MILVTGASGTVGAEIVRQLRAGGQPVRALTRARHRAESVLGSDVEIVEGDLAQPDTLEAALQGVDALYLLVPLDPSLRQLDAAAIAAAKRAGVRHLVKHSNIGADDDQATIMQRWHREGERLIEDSGMTWTFIRPTGFMSNALGWAQMIRHGDTVYSPGGDGKLAAVDPRDIAAAAAVVLTQPGHEGKAYDITGPTALSTADQVRIIGDEIGKPLVYVDIPNSAARESMLGMGIPPENVDALLEFMTLIREGKAATVSDAVEKLTGHPAHTFGDWVHDHAANFQ